VIILGSESPPPSAPRSRREEARAVRREIEAAMAVARARENPESGPSMAVDSPPPDPPSRLVTAPVTSPAQKLLRILAGTQKSGKPLTPGEQDELLSYLSTFVQEVNSMLPPEKHFGVLPPAASSEAVRPMGRTATSPKQSDPSPQPAKPGPRPSQPLNRPSYANAVKAQEVPGLAKTTKHLQQGTKATHTIIRTQATRRDSTSASTIEVGLRRLDFIKDGSIVIKSAEWTMHGDFRIITTQPITPEQQSAFLKVVSTYATVGTAPIVLNRPTVTSLKFSLVPFQAGDHLAASTALEHEIRAHPKWKDITLHRPPYFAVPKDYQGPVATVRVDVVDTRAGSVSRRLLHTDVNIYRET